MNALAEIILVLLLPLISGQPGNPDPAREALRGFLKQPGQTTAQSIAAIPATDIRKLLIQAMPHQTDKPPDDKSGKIVFGGDRDYYLYDLPENYDPARPWPLIVSLHGNPPGHCERVHHKYWRKEPAGRGYVLVSPNLDGGRWQRSKGQEILFRALFDAVMRFHVDWTRIYLNGYSAGASATWKWGTTYSDIFAAIIVRCGIRRVDNATLKTNLKGRGVYLIHAAQDSKCPVEQAREGARLLKRYSIEHVYAEFPGEHDFYWCRNQEILDFLGRFSLPTGSAFHMRGDFEKLRMVNFLALRGEDHGVTAKVEGNNISMDISNEKKLQDLDLYLPASVDLSRPVTIRLNKHQLTTAPAPSSQAFADAWMLYPFASLNQLQRVFTSKIALVKDGAVSGEQ